MSFVVRVSPRAEVLGDAVEALVDAGADAVEIVGSRALGLFRAGDPEAAQARVRVALGAAGRGAKLRLEAPVWLDDASTWRAGVRPFRVGALRFVPMVGGALADGSTPELGPGDVPLEVGTAFGSGGHPTTWLMLERLVERPPLDQSVLDLGTGTGVLAIAALKLGARGVVGADLDAASVALAAQNAHIADVGDRFFGTTTPVTAMTQRFQRIVANIVAAPLIDLAPTLVGRIAPGGELSLSGFVPEQALRVAKVYRDRGMRVVGEAERDGWVRLDIAPGW